MYVHRTASGWIRNVTFQRVMVGGRSITSPAELGMTVDAGTTSGVSFIRGQGPSSVQHTSPSQHQSLGVPSPSSVTGPGKSFARSQPERQILPNQRGSGGVLPKYWWQLGGQMMRTVSPKCDGLSYKSLLGMISRLAKSNVRVLALNSVYDSGSGYSPGDLWCGLAGSNYSRPDPHGIGTVAEWKHLVKVAHQSGIAIISWWKSVNTRFKPPANAAPVLLETGMHPTLAHADGGAFANPILAAHRTSGQEVHHSGKRKQTSSALGSMHCPRIARQNGSAGEHRRGRRRL